MTSFSNLRARLVGTVFIAITPAWVLMYYTNLPWTGFIVGLLALTAAWFGGERFILRQVRILLAATERLAEGDLTSRTGLAKETGELGDLARKIDTLAEKLEQRARDREKVEKTLLTRSLQQTVVSALGQFALVKGDFPALLNQAVMLVAQTLEVEYCGVLELQPNGQTLALKTGVGWRSGAIGRLELSADPATQAGYTLRAGEPVVVENLKTERRFTPSPFLAEHGVVSGVTVAVPRSSQPFGILGAFTTNQRTFTGDEVQFLLAVATVLAMAVERAQAEAQLQKLAAFARLNPNPAMELDCNGELTYANQAAESLAEEIGVEGPPSLLPPDKAEIVRECLNTGESKLQHETKLGGRTLSWSFHPVEPSQVVHAYTQDITERLSLEEQLRQSQKMESVGQLAAGVAHDFNNMLTVIQGHSGMLLAKKDLPVEAHNSAKAITFAAERSAGLTRQLLMFSRKNIMQPRLLDLRHVIGQMTSLLQRLLGETIQIAFEGAEAIPLVLADAGMVEQVLLNLVVNARDAMPKGGTLTIGLRAVEVDEAFTRRHPEARIGPYVGLYVADTGTGMDQGTVSHIFEPFFTTKEVGRGTGLGLATVYGIVKQHEGWIEVASELGKGARFDIYFPATDQTAPLSSRSTDTTSFVKGGGETILVVEDEPSLRELAEAILENCGYSVLKAASGPEALRIWEDSKSRIDMVVTDMVMPEGMSGKDLAERLHQSNPALKIVFVSGYSMEETDPTFLTKGSAVFLQKPYTHISLTKAVRECFAKGK